jgi:cell division protease FtsH
MGGRAAEELVLKKMTTGAGNDIERATMLARKYVTEWGMSNLGPVNYGQKQGPVFLGRDIQRRSDLSEQTALRIDREIQRIIMTSYDTAVQILEDNRDALEALALGLLELETLTHDEIVALVDGTPLEDLKAKRSAREEALKRRKKEAREAEEAEAALERPEVEPPSRPTPSIVPLKPGDEQT